MSKDNSIVQIDLMFYKCDEPIKSDPKSYGNDFEAIFAKNGWHMQVIEQSLVDHHGYVPTESMNLVGMVLDEMGEAATEEDKLFLDTAFEFGMKMLDLEYGSKFVLDSESDKQGEKLNNPFQNDTVLEFLINGNVVPAAFYNAISEDKKYWTVSILTVWKFVDESTGWMGDYEPDYWIEFLGIYAPWMEIPIVKTVDQVPEHTMFFEVKKGGK